MSYVLVVDDDDALGESIRELIEEIGVRAVRVDNGARALELLRSGEHPAVVLLDLMMPVMNGVAFREEQLRDPALAAIPVVVMTASRDLQGITADEIAYKPVKLARLIEIVRTYARPQQVEPRVHPLFVADGELAGRMAAIDWSTTSLGPVDSWPQSLKTCVRVVLTSQQPMFVWWGPELINLYNDAYISIVGGKHPQALGQPASVVWSEIWEAVDARASTAMRTNKGTYDEALLLIMHRHGYDEETYYTFSYSPVPDDNGAPGGILCANTDDTQRIIGGRQLTLLRALAEATSDARTLTEVYRQACHALGTNQRDLPFVMLYRLDADRSHFALEAVSGVRRGMPGVQDRIELDQVEPWPFARVPTTDDLQVVGDLEQRLHTVPTGAWDRAPTQAAVIPIAGAGGKRPAGMLVIGLNPFRRFDAAYRSFVELIAGQIAAAIANAQAYEEERRRAEALAEIDRAKTAFFSNISHEFRTPLTLMMGPTEDLLDGAHGELAAAQRDQLELVHRNEMRLQKLVNALLDFSRIEAGRIQATYEPVDLAAITRDLAAAFQSAIEKAELELVVDVPALDEAVYVDRDMWEKIVLNLLSNAYKFTFEGRITVALHRDRDRVMLTVADTGAGVPEHEVPRLFERFHRVEGARSRTHEGSGIGLALVQELVRLHGGSIDVESELGVGTTFTIMVPLGCAHLPPERVGIARATASTNVAIDAYVGEASRWSSGLGFSNPAIDITGAMPRLSGAPDRATLLIADDNADMREYLRKILDSRFTVLAADNGLEALEMTRRCLPDLVLTDVMMPGLDGFALLRELRADPATRLIPIVMLSARAGEEARVEGLHAGVDDYLVKPFSARELLARVTTHLEIARLRRSIDDERRKLFVTLMQAPFAVAVLAGPEHVYELANPLYETMFREGVTGKPLRAAFPHWPADAAPFRLVDRVYRTGEPAVEHEYRLLLDPKHTGTLEERFVQFTLQPIGGLDGVTRVMAVAVDVTMQVQARRAIEASELRWRESEARLAMAQRAGEIGMFDWAPQRDQMYWSPELCRMLGASPDIQPSAEAWIARMDPADRATAMATFDAAVAQRLESITHQYRIVTQTGERRWIRLSMAFHHDAAGRLERVVGAAIDIHPLIQAIEREQLAREDAERAARFSEMFVGILGHDLRNPLNAITLATGLIEGRSSDEKIAKPAARIASSAHRMTRMIDQLLDFTRIRVGRGLPLEYRRSDLAEIARGAIDEIELASKSPLRLEVTGDPVGTWDRDRLSQLVSNLVANACTHGTASAEVVVRIDGGRADRVGLEVRNGGAIPRELLPDVFEPLRAEVRKSAGSSGLGLGLYITQQIVLAHRGDIRVESDEERGTRFIVQLPRAATAAEHVFGDQGPASSQSLGRE